MRDGLLGRATLRRCQRSQEAPGDPQENWIIARLQEFWQISIFVRWRVSAEHGPSWPDINKQYDTDKQRLSSFNHHVSRPPSLSILPTQLSACRLNSRYAHGLDFCAAQTVYRVASTQFGSDPGYALKLALSYPIELHLSRQSHVC
ncbi:hypothetical protein C8J57DRAFT_1477616 [Mycena rebaudengoi]|nr:hypothetical protein C8J57DRAFT_1477616 [Mycena rebaudengoi]